MNPDGMGAAPEVSVVVASFSGEPALERCLTSLEAGAADAEWVIATTAPADAVAGLAARFPAARFFCYPAGTSVFRLRSRGLEEARGQMIAMIEDHCTVVPGWLATLRSAHAAGESVVGGPIDHDGGQRPCDLAIYFCEYSAYMPLLPAGSVSALLAANASYRREALWACHATWEEAFYDNEVHDALRAAGHALHLEPGACVSSHLAMSLGEASSHLYTGGTRFGGYRKAHSSPVRRLFWLLASPAVPLVMLVRLIRRVAGRRPDRLGWLLRALPYCLYLSLAWSLGEARGYLAPAPPTAGRPQEA
jgi:hypothetical protein